MGSSGTGPSGEAAASSSTSIGALRAADRPRPAIAGARLARHDGRRRAARPLGDATCGPGGRDLASRPRPPPAHPRGACGARRHPAPRIHLARHAPAAIAEPGRLPGSRPRSIGSLPGVDPDRPIRPLSGPPSRRPLAEPRRRARPHRFIGKCRNPYPLRGVPIARGAETGLARGSTDRPPPRFRRPPRRVGRGPARPVTGPLVATGADRRTLSPRWGEDPTAARPPGRIPDRRRRRGVWRALPAAPRRPGCPGCPGGRRAGRSTRAGQGRRRRRRSYRSGRRSAAGSAAAAWRGRSCSSNRRRPRGSRRRPDPDPLSRLAAAGRSPGARPGAGPTRATRRARRPGRCRVGGSRSRAPRPGRRQSDRTAGHARGRPHRREDITDADESRTAGARREARPGACESRDRRPTVPGRHAHEPVDHFR